MKVIAMILATGCCGYHDSCTKPVGEASTLPMEKEDVKGKG